MKIGDLIFQLVQEWQKHGNTEVFLTTKNSEDEINHVESFHAQGDSSKPMLTTISSLEPE